MTSSRSLSSTRRRKTSRATSTRKPRVSSARVPAAELAETTAPSSKPPPASPATTNSPPPPPLSAESLPVHQRIDPAPVEALHHPRPAAHPALANRLLE